MSDAVMNGVCFGKRQMGRTALGFAPPFDEPLQATGHALGRQREINLDALADEGA
jgi:hypothetical protein